MLFAEAKANNFRNLVFYDTPYGSSQMSERHIYCCACQSLRVCLAADTGHSRGVRELNYLTLIGVYENHRSTAPRVSWRQGWN